MAQNTRTPEEEAAYLAYLRNDREREEMNKRISAIRAQEAAEEAARLVPVEIPNNSMDGQTIADLIVSLQGLMEECGPGATVYFYDGELTVWGTK